MELLHAYDGKLWDRLLELLGPVVPTDCSSFLPTSMRDAAFESAVPEKPGLAVGWKSWLGDTLPRFRLQRSRRHDAASPSSSCPLFPAASMRSLSPGRATITVAADSRQCKFSTASLGRAQSRRHACTYMVRATGFRPSSTPNCHGRRFHWMISFPAPRSNHVPTKARHML